jgi:hypothetical protein
MHPREMRCIFISFILLHPNQDLPCYVDVTPVEKGRDRERVLCEVADMFGDSRKEWQISL